MHLRFRIWANGTTSSATFEKYRFPKLTPSKGSISRKGIPRRRFVRNASVTLQKLFFRLDCEVLKLYSLPLDRTVPSGVIHRLERVGVPFRKTTYLPEKADQYVSPTSLSSNKIGQRQIATRRPDRQEHIRHTHPGRASPSRRIGSVRRLSP